MRTPILAALAALAVLGGCASTMTVDQDWSEKADFAAYQRFAVPPAPDGSRVNPVVAQRVHDAIVNELQSRGYAHDESAPDFAVAYHVMLQDKVDVQTWDYTYAADSEWHDNDVTETAVIKGTLLIDFVDPGTKEVFWRGWVSDEVDESARTPEYLGKAVAKILDQYPPR